jgi:hypothetical protein
MFAARMRARLTDTLLLALGALVLYAALAQRTLYGDGLEILDLARQGVLGNEKHFLYLPLLAGVRALLPGFTLVEVATGLSVACAALGVAVTHLGLRALRLARADALLAGALVALAPGVVFYATLVELHAPFFAVAAFALLALARLLQRPNLGGAALLGAATGASFAAHATGALLPAPLLLAAFALTRGRHAQYATVPARAWLPLAAVTATVHVVLVFGLPQLLQLLGKEFNVAARESVKWIEQNSVPDWTHPATLPRTLWNEWLWAFAPVSVASLAGSCRARTRGLAFALLLGALPYLYVSQRLLAGHSEHGAYWLPLGALAAWATVWALPRAAATALVVAAAACALVEVKRHDDPERSSRLARGLRAVVSPADAILLTAGFRDVEAVLVRMPEASFNYVRLDRLAEHLRHHPEQVAPVLARLDEELGKWRAQGKRLFVTQELLDVVGQRRFLAAELVDRQILPHLRSRWRIEPVASEGFVAQELVAPQ